VCKPRVLLHSACFSALRLLQCIDCVLTQCVLSTAPPPATHCTTPCNTYRNAHGSTSTVSSHSVSSCLDGYCSTVQGLLDWCEVDLGFAELLFIQTDLRVLCDCVLYSPVSLSSCPFFGHPALPPPRGGSASRVSPHTVCAHTLTQLMYTAHGNTSDVSSHSVCCSV